MKELPKGKCCAHCTHHPRCSWLIGRRGSEHECDFEPSRFVDDEEHHAAVRKRAAEIDAAAKAWEVG